MGINMLIELIVIIVCYLLIAIISLGIGIRFFNEDEDYLIAHLMWPIMPPILLSIWLVGIFSDIMMKMSNWVADVLYKKFPPKK